MQRTFEENRALAEEFVLTSADNPSEREWTALENFLKGGSGGKGYGSSKE
jgi:hypothetical protein